MPASGGKISHLDGGERRGAGWRHLFPFMNLSRSGAGPMALKICRNSHRSRPGNPRLGRKLFLKATFELLILPLFCDSTQKVFQHARRHPPLESQMLRNEIGMTELPFQSRSQAGQLLAAELKHHKLPLNTLILALPRGGVTRWIRHRPGTALPMDVLVARKLACRGNTNWPWVPLPASP